MTEVVLPKPEDPYGISKYAVELDLAAAHQMFGLPTIILRPHNVYGERQNISDKYRNVIGIFMNQVMNKQAMTVFGDGLQTRAFSHISDVAPIIARSPLVQEAYQEVFNVGADQPFTILELASSVAEAFGVKPVIEHLPPRNEVEHVFASHDKVNRVFTPPHSLPLQEGLNLMAEWAKREGPMTPVTFDNIEIPLNLPPSWQ